MRSILLESLRRAATGAIGLSLGVLAGCGNDPPGEGEPSSAATGDLAAYNTTLWNANGNVVNLCWVTTGLTSAKTAVRNAVTAAWQGNSGLTLNWPANPATDVCPRVSPGSPVIAPQYMPLYIHAAAGPGDWGGGCAGGYGARMATSDCGGSAQCQCAFADGSFDTPTFLLGTAIHEIGHGLGLPHEHQRNDRPGNIASTCVDPVPGTDKWSDAGNYIVDNSLRLLTSYDGLNSIMSYCRDYNQDGLFDNPPSVELSALDKLGIEMLYPWTLSRRPILSAGVATTDGTQTVVRTDVTTALNVDWITRGGLTGAVSSVRWRDGAGTILSTSPSMSLVFPANRTIQVELNDVLGRHHSWTGTNVVANNALHTAILLPRVALL